jgi:Txe/YoeB family toxin of Txe-Axe toxin-antitoxin module
MRKGDERIYKRPRTIIPDEEEYLCNYGDCSPVREIPPMGLQDTPLLDPCVSEGSKGDQHNTLITENNTNPWEIFEPIAKISQNRSIFLSRNRRLKHRLVHIEQLDEEASSLVSTPNLLGKIHHRSFLNLHESYHNANSVFFVWEPVEVSISQIMASKCMITAGEIIAIVRPVRNNYCKLVCPFV